MVGKREYVDFEEKNKKLFQTWAKKYSIDIVTGSFIEGEKDKWFNTSYYIDKNGKIKARYKKINLWHPERRYLTAGKNVTVFQTKFGKAGLMNL
ncbi:MAG: hypothetical protein CEO12_444 [Parcubacteria group bacterium Gr01-1014_46]|nr:MAG: hypothetical protein CEO12_444 [Parcubacteria group bacterium Gr01-1014_46]